MRQHAGLQAYSKFVVLSLAFVMTAFALPSAEAEVAIGGTGRPFASSSIWNSAIPASAVLDPNSAAMVAALNSASTSPNSLLYAYGVPIYSVSTDTPLVNVRCLSTTSYCSLPPQIRIPADAHANTGSDRAMLVVDWANNTAYEFWQATKVSATQWDVNFGSTITNISSASGVGVGMSAARLPFLGGTIRQSEIAAGHIPHALQFSSSMACAGTFRYPAAKTDGTSYSAGCIPEGARIQLDPSINLAAISGITPAELAVGKALQTYGAYAVDKGGSPLSFVFELDPSSTPSSPLSSTYLTAGLKWDYYFLSKLPRTSLRVLQRWDGGGGSYTAPAPAAPTALTATANAGPSVALKWTAPTGTAPTNYAVWRGDGNYANWKQIGQPDGLATTYSDTTAAPQTAYTYAVRSLSELGSPSASSNSVRVTTGIATTTTTTSAVTTTTATSTTPPPATTTTTTTTTTPPPVTTTTPPPVTTTTTTTATPPPVTTTTAPPVTTTLAAPIPPTGLRVSSQTFRSVALRWTAPTGTPAASYLVFRGNASGAGAVQIGQVSTLTFTDMTVARRTTYTYYVVSVDARGLMSSPSQMISVSVK